MAEVRVIVANIEKIKCEPEDVLGEILPYYTETFEHERLRRITHFSEILHLV